MKEYVIICSFEGQIVTVKFYLGPGTAMYPEMSQIEGQINIQTANRVVASASCVRPKATI